MFAQMCFKTPFRIWVLRRNANAPLLPLGNIEQESIQNFKINVSTATILPGPELACQLRYLRPGLLDFCACNNEIDKCDVILRTFERPSNYQHTFIWRRVWNCCVVTWLDTGRRCTVAMRTRATLQYSFRWERFKILSQIAPLLASTSKNHNGTFCYVSSKFDRLWRQNF